MNSALCSKRLVAQHLVLKETLEYKKNTYNIINKHIVERHSKYTVWI